MEHKESIIKDKKLFLGKKLKNPLIKIKNDDNMELEEINKDSILFETSTELSNDNSLNSDEKFGKIPGLDDINIPSFLNDININSDINKKIKNYYKIRKELGSKELTKLFLVDIKRLYKEKENYKV